MVTLPDDTSQNELMHSLLVQLLALREHILQRGMQRLAEVEAGWPDKAAQSSATNLAHYLALREQDLRCLQSQLACAGLSSLGRGEAHVLDNVDQVLSVLQHIVNNQHAADVDPLGHLRYDEGRRLLRQRNQCLFGPLPADCDTHIMVTMPREAAYRYELVKELLSRGMHCARINCAHDTPELWQQMVVHIRQASEALNKDCRILMDLAGYKLRTGPVQCGTGIRRLKPMKDELGRVVEPLLVRLVPHRGAPRADSEGQELPVPENLYRRLQRHDELRFVDGRGKKRVLTILACDEGGRWVAHLHKSTYLLSNTPLELWRSLPDGRCHLVYESHFNKLKGSEDEVRLYRGDRFYLSDRESSCRPATADRLAVVACTLSQVVAHLRTGQSVWIDDGRLGAVVERIEDKHHALLRVTHAGPKGLRIKAQKGINLPDTDLNLPPLSLEDLEHLDFVAEQADMVAMSFLSRDADLIQLREQLDRRCPGKPIIAKIETRQAVQNLPSILFAGLAHGPFGVMIARGDLAVELGSVRMSEIQEEILWLCEAAHVPVIWATQVLESLAKKGLIARAEITDAAMSVRAECVMLNKGPYIAEAVQVLADILSRMQAHQYKKVPRLRALHW